MVEPPFVSATQTKSVALRPAWAFIPPDFTERTLALQIRYICAARFWQPSALFSADF